MPSFKTYLSVVLVLALTACAGSYDRTDLTPTAENYETFLPVGAGMDSRYFEDDSRDQLTALKAEMRKTLAQVPRGRGLDILALSGGGQHGAYGAGVLNGWTDTGTRPTFDVVTGISTGALIAPFAFLGSDYDDRLQRFYTETATRDVVRLNLPGAVFGRGFLTKATPLKEAIRQELTDDLIRKIAEQHRKGRQLLIGTTNIDAERPVLWNIGAIAQSDTPKARELIRDVILASASIPVVFQPVSIEITNGEVQREELHVDGGLTREIFAYPHDLQMRQLLRAAGLSNQKNRIWLIHNKKLEPTFDPLPGNATAVANRAFEMLIRSQSLGNIESILALSNRDGFQANITYIPKEFQTKPDEPFDPKYMTELFSVGYWVGQHKDGWIYDAQNWQ
ncbi:patatin-like phospholipase family protein [Ruegeria arenilitoris]|uniref:patatin-like phospholipase family protein n=1 Tax=Ruegeria arenilitoris TaxID=1173585 RepID=UPI00147CA02B|nr:patatin-like phospholipase family protein [Ruegeria arenilitoris]